MDEIEIAYTWRSSRWITRNTPFVVWMICSSIKQHVHTSLFGLSTICRHSVSTDHKTGIRIRIFWESDMSPLEERMVPSASTIIAIITPFSFTYPSYPLTCINEWSNEIGFHFGDNCDHHVLLHFSFPLLSDNRCSFALAIVTSKSTDTAPIPSSFFRSHNHRMHLRMAHVFPAFHQSHDTPHIQMHVLFLLIFPLNPMSTSISPSCNRSIGNWVLSFWWSNCVGVWGGDWKRSPGDCVQRKA